MKTLAVAVFAALGLAVPALAKPTGPLNQRNADEKLSPVVVARAPEVTEHFQVVQYVDQNGNPIRKATEAFELIAPAAATHAAEAVGAPEIHGTETATPAADSEAVGTPIAGVHEDSSAAANATTPGVPRSLPGIAYAPYMASGECKTQAMIEEDFGHFRGKYSLVRIYGTDCDQVSKVFPAAKNAGLRLFLGLFEMANIDQQVKHIVDSVKGDWAIVDTISVGNELINNGAAQLDELIGAMNQAKSLLRAAGYQGPVVIVDTFIAVLANPALCDESDYCAMNLHPFFDGNVAAPGSGEFIAKMVSEVRTKLADKSKRIVITETGWPWKGTNNGAAHPGLQQQKQAIDSISAVYANEPENLILFSAFNDPWKPSEARTFYAEQFWGIEASDSNY